MLTRDFVHESRRRSALQAAALKAPRKRRSIAQLREDRERKAREAQRAHHAARGSVYLRAPA